MLYLTAGLNLALVLVVVLVIRGAMQLVTAERANAADASAHAVTCMAAERADWATERADLLQRIQAPEHAVMQHALTQPLPPSPASVPVDDDDAFWEAQMTKDQLAQFEAERERAEAGA